MSKTATIYDIAEKLNLSPSTISRAISNAPNIGSKTKEKVLSTARQMGYTSNLFASSLRTRKSNMLGVIVPKLNSNFMADVIAGVEKVASAENFQLIIFQSAESVKKEMAGVKSMLASRVDGLLVSLAYDSLDTSHFDEFVKREVPVIFFDRFFDHSHYPNIHINNYKAGYNMTTHLIQQGCQRIMHLTADGMPSIYRARFDGYRQALTDNALSFEKELLITNDLSGNAGNIAAETILKMETRPDGIFSANDHCVINCMVRLKKAGMRIPEDIAIAGFNNDPACLIVEPNLTTIEYNGYEMGEQAAKQIINQLKTEQPLQTAYSVILRHKLTIRESSLRAL